MPSLDFQPSVAVFDANVRVGHRHDEISPAPDRSALLAEMERHGVARALVYHAQTETISPVDGNCQLRSWLDSDDCLVPQWSILPTPESMQQIRDLHAEEQVRSVRAHDTSPAGLPFRPWAWGELLSWLEEEQIPLWIPLPEAEPDALITTLGAFPSLVTVLVGAHYTHRLLVRPFLRSLPNAYLELSRYEPMGELEALQDEFGAQRLLYASWYPRYAMGPILFYLHQAALSPNELALICAGNLERILGGGRADVIDGTRVIDFHGHVGRWDLNGMHDDPAPRLHAMDRAGIDVACVFNIFHPDGTTGNDLTARFVAQHPDRFIGFAFVSPLMPDHVVPELTRAIDTLGFAAIKLYPPYTPWPINHQRWYPIYEFAHRRSLAVLFHTGTEPQSLPRYLGEIAPKFPNANFVAGHAGNLAPERRQAVAAAQAYPNVYLETCSTFRTPGVIEELVAEAGSERVIFGSDQPLMDPRSQLGKIITARIPESAKRQILGDNACRLLNL